MLLRKFVLSVCFVAARSSSAPAHCVHVTDGEFKCDYATMGAGEHPIDFTAFDLKPQRLDVSVNGIVPYIGEYVISFTLLRKYNKHSYTCIQFIIIKEIAVILLASDKTGLYLLLLLTALLLQQEQNLHTCLLLLSLMNDVYMT